MTSTIDGAGRVVIPKALRERAGLVPGARIDFTFHDGAIEVRPADEVRDEVEWEKYRGINWPVPSGATMSDDQARALLETVRDERTERVFDGGR